MAGAPTYLQLWEDAQTGDAYAPDEARAVRAFLGRGFGTRTRLGPADHQQGLVAEHLWHMLQAECPTDVPIDYISPPHFDPTAPGADAIVLFGGTDPSFRLWELKKAGLGYSSTLAQAYRQLSDKGDVYVAQITAVANESENLALRSVSGKLLGWWTDGTNQANAGVGVTSPAAPAHCFSTMRDRVIFLGRTGAHAGTFISVPDFPAFCDRVREVLWTGL